MSKTGLILEGGAMRGLFTVGVLDVWMEHDIPFDGMIGVSAGACFGCNYVSKQPGRAIRYNKKYCKDPRYASWRSFFKTGNMFGTEFCYRQLPYELDAFDGETFEQNPMEFHVVATDVETGKPVYQLCKKNNDWMLDWVRASSSMPVVSQIVEVDGKKLLDGGISDSIPLAYFESIGYDRNVVILTQPEDYVKQKDSMLPLVKLALHGYPNVVNAEAHRHEMYNEETAYVKERVAAGAAFAVYPEEKLPIGHVSHDPAVLQNVYEIGRAAGEKSLEGVKRFLGL